MKMLLFSLGILSIVLLLFWFLGCTPQKRGTSGDSFASNGRPALIVNIRNDMTLTDGYWCDVSLPTQQSQPGNARVYYTLYEGNPSFQESSPAPEQKARALILLAEAGSNWEWPNPSHSPREILRQNKEIINGSLLYRETLLLKPETDPFNQSWQTTWTQGTLSRRFRYFFQHNSVKLIMEYREPLSDSTIVDDLHQLRAFEARAEQVFTLVRLTPQDPAFANIKTLSTAPTAISRRELGKWLGDVYRRGRME